MSRLKLTETFVSIQGEADAVGWPTLFIRLTGCPLRCVYCDTQYAFYGGEWRTVDELLQVARDKGFATGIGHPYEATLEYLEKAIPTLTQLNIELVPVSEMIRLQQGATDAL